jgi:hypothetical protein
MEIIDKIDTYLGTVKLNDSIIELKIIGAILVNGNSIELQLKNAKYIKYNMERELSIKLQDIWLEELNRRNIEAERCSKNKEPKTSLSDAIIQGVLKGLEEVEEKEVVNSCDNCKYGSGFRVCSLCINYSEWSR